MPELDAAWLKSVGSHELGFHSPAELPFWLISQRRIEEKRLHHFLVRLVPKLRYATFRIGQAALLSDQVETRILVQQRKNRYVLLLAAKFESERTKALPLRRDEHRSRCIRSIREVALEGLCP